MDPPPSLTLSAGMDPPPSLASSACGAGPPAGSAGAGPDRRRSSHKATAVAASSSGATRSSARRGGIAADHTDPVDDLYPAAMDLGLDGKVALVTGASRGIGLGIAKALAAEGARVAISSRSRERIEAAAAQLGALALVHDSADLDGAAALVDRVERELGPLEVLIANTGGPPGSPDPLSFTRAQWRRPTRELVLAPMALIERALPGMRERGFGRILNVSSSTVPRADRGSDPLQRPPKPDCSPPSRLSRQVAGEGVTLNTVLPGRIATDRLAELHGSLEHAAAAAGQQVPAGRLGSVEELAAAAVFLCSEPASYVTGVALRVDGGLTQSV